MSQTVVEKMVGYVAIGYLDLSRGYPYIKKFRCLFGRAQETAFKNMA